jgi:hypothetical protein
MSVKSLLSQSMRKGLQDAVYTELYQSNLWKSLANQLQKLGYSVDIIENKFNKERDIRIGKSRLLLNIHFGYGDGTNHIYESIRCERWRHAGMLILSEKSLFNNPGLIECDYNNIIIKIKSILGYPLLIKEDLIMKQFKKNVNGFNKEDIINYLINSFYYKSYLEISTVTSGFVYDKIINIEKHLFLYQTEYHENINIREDITENITIIKNLTLLEKYDIIFVDPYHTFEQSYDDICLAFKLLNDNGIIVIHDCYPKYKELAKKQYKYGPWCGETYKALINFNYKNNMVQTYVVDCDFGCGIILKNKSRLFPYLLKDIIVDNIDYEYFILNTNKLLDIITVGEFLNIIDNMVFNGTTTLII